MFKMVKLCAWFRAKAGSETAVRGSACCGTQLAEQGASWLHLVDLDAAFGRGSNHELLADVVGRLDIDVELSGGIRDNDTLSAALATGCRRINIGTAALENPDWCARVIAEHGDKVAIGLDVRGTTRRARLDARRWRAVCDDRAAQRRGLCTIRGHRRREGRHVVGPNIHLLHQVCKATDRPIVASGGVSSLEDIHAVAELVPHGVGGLDYRQGALRLAPSRFPKLWQPLHPHRLHEPAVQRA